MGYIRYWLGNFREGYVNAFKWMGFWGYVVDVLIAAVAVYILGNGWLENVLIFIAAVFIVFGFIGFMYSIFRQPYNIYVNQRKAIERMMPDQLDIFVGPSPMKGWVSGDDSQLLESCLTVINRGKKKIVEFHATKLELLQRTAMTGDIRGKWFGYTHANIFFPWRDGSKSKDVLPDSTDEIIIAELDTKIGYPVFGSQRVSLNGGEVPSIYEVYLRFKGKLEGETDFRYYNYRIELYSHPEFEILDFAEDSHDIPDDLKSKVLFANKRIETND